MKDNEKSKDELVSELIKLRNRVIDLKRQIDDQSAEVQRRDEEDLQLKNIREYAAWVLYATPAVVCVLSPEGKTRFINPFTHRVTGYRAEEILGHNWWKLFFPGEEYQQVGKLFREFEKGDVRDHEMTLIAKNGMKMTLSWHSINRHDEQGNLKEIILVGIDVTARKEAEDRLESSEERMRTLLGNIPSAVYRFAPDEKLTVLHMTSFIENITGYRNWELVNNNFFTYSDIIHQDDKQYVIDEIHKAVQTGQPYMLEYRIKRSDGNIRWVHDKGQGYLGKSLKVEWVDGALFDITDRKDMEKKLAETLEKVKNLSLTDDLTQLCNRRGFITHAEQQIRLAQRGNRPTSIIFVDLDGMKEINDRFGHKMGDQALIDTANLLRNTFRKSDVVARLGGDEFACLAIESDGVGADIMVERLMKQVEKFNSQPDIPYHISMSTGIADYDPKSGQTIEQLIETADRRMYERKRKKYESGEHPYRRRQA